MCGGGGSAAKAAQQQEAARQAGITQAVGQINSIYGSPQRQQQYTDFQNAMQAYNLNQLDKQKTDADRNLNFALARQGLTGGSADADASANLAKDYNQGVLKSEQAASSAASQLQAQDQAQKQQLIGLAESGLDATSASNQALTGLQTNLANAMAQGQAQDLGDMFSGLANYYTNSQQADAYRKSLNGTQTYGLFGPTLNGQYIGPGSLSVQWPGQNTTNI